MTVTIPYTTNRNHTVDLLRFLSAIYVALFHINAPRQFERDWFSSFCNYGNLGVPVFFIISGYCIRLAQEHTKTPGEFIIRRLFRIFPPYWFSLAVVLAVIFILKTITGFNSVAVLPKTAGSILATVCLYTAPLSTIQVINLVYWTLPYELAFYLIISLAMIATTRLRLLLPLLLSATALFIPVQPGGVFFFFNELPTFMLGYALYILIKEPNSIRLQGSLLFLLAAAGVYLKHENLPFLLACIIPVVLIAADSIRPLKENLFSSLGDISYSIYLLHVPVCVYLLGFVQHIAAVRRYIILNIAADILLLLLITLLAPISYRYIELPSIKSGKKLSR